MSEMLTVQTRPTTLVAPVTTDSSHREPSGVEITTENKAALRTGDGYAD